MGSTRLIHDRSLFSGSLTLCSLHKIPFMSLRPKFGYWSTIDATKLSKSSSFSDVYVSFIWNSEFNITRAHNTFAFKITLYKIHNIIRHSNEVKTTYFYSRLSHSSPDSSNRYTNMFGDFWNGELHVHKITYCVHTYWKRSLSPIVGHYYNSGSN